MALLPIDQPFQRGNVSLGSGLGSIEGGYEASITDVFQQNTLVGVVTVAILVSGPLLGVATARRLRAKRDRRESQ
jgi:hypothetical protein